MIVVREAQYAMAMRPIPLLLLAILIGGCAHAPAAPEPPSPAEAELRQRILEETLAQIGRPYVYGGGDYDGFDCSGLVRHVYADAGIGLPRTAAQQRREGRAVSPEAALPGDLLFYRIDGGNHVVIYVGDGRGVHAPKPGRAVTVAEIDQPWWRERLHTARSLID